MVILIDHIASLPCKQPVADTSAEHQRQAQVDVVRHEDEHETVAEEEVKDVQQRLQDVVGHQHLRARRRLLHRCAAETSATHSN